MEISAIIITKNERENIVDVIKNLKFTDEIIVIDNKSEDETVKLAKKHGAKVYSRKFNDFAQQRNFGLEKTKGEWTLYVDADERVSSELQREILDIIRSKTNLSGYRIPRKNYYFSNHEWPHVERLERLFKRNKLQRWEGAIHESSVVKGEVGELENYLIHHTHKDLSSMIKKTNEWSEIEAQLLYKAGHPKMVWWRFIRIMLTKFYDSFIRQGGWKVGWVGWIESIYQAFSYFVVYAKLWEKQQE